MTHNPVEAEEGTDVNQKNRKQRRREEAVARKEAGKQRAKHNEKKHK
jgi:hypothetical protein